MLILGIFELYGVYIWWTTRIWLKNANVRVTCLFKALCKMPYLLLALENVPKIKGLVLLELADGRFVVNHEIARFSQEMAAPSHRKTSIAVAVAIAQAVFLIISLTLQALIQSAIFLSACPLLRHCVQQCVKKEGGKRGEKRVQSFPKDKFHDCLSQKIVFHHISAKKQFLGQFTHS